VETVRINDVDVAYLTAGIGPSNGPLALCLHGFPDTANTWRHLLPRLAQAGFRTVAPFARGYAPTAVPADGRYQTGALAADANALHDALDGDGDAVIIGHDWGAPSAYGAAGHQPDRWSRVVGMAVPPGGALATAFVTDLDQVQRSWYMFLFQHPLAELLLGANDFALVDRLWAQWSPGYDAAEDIRYAKEALRPPGHLPAAISYYRDAPTGVPSPADAAGARETLRRLEVPLLYLHGARDGCIGLDSVELVRPWFPPRTRTVVLENADHFVQLEQPQEFNRLVIEFIAAAGE